MGTVQGLKTNGDAAFKAKHYDLAVQHYSTALQKCEELQQPEMLHLLYSNRSAARLALQDFQGALSDAQASVAVDVNWVKGWYRSAKALQGLGKAELAAQAAGRALVLEPSNKDVQQLLLQLKTACTAGTSSSSAPDHHHKPERQSSQHDDPEQQLLQQQQQQQQQPGTTQLSWPHMNQLRSQLDLHKLNLQLVAGSRYLASPDGINQNLLLLLHGLGDKPAAFTALAQRMHLPQTACLALSGPMLVPETDGGRAWFTAFDEDWQLIKPSPGDSRRASSLAATLQLVQQLLFEVLPAVGGWCPGEIQVLGFSQGGTVALELACSCRGSQRLGGVVCISAALLEETLQRHGGGTRSCEGCLDSTDVLITHGERDQVVPRQLVTETISLLRSAGCEVQLKTLPGKGHGMISSEDEMRTCMQFWAKHLKHRPADPDLVEV